MAYNFNNIQTQLTDDVLDMLAQAVRSDLTECIEQIPFIRNLSAADRKRVSDVEINPETGKIIVDITNPHILENMDYFRQSAIHFQNHGCYTFLYPNRAPNSEYVKFWKQEAKRCREGMVREDGEWITGYYYFYLNYSPIQKIIEREGSKRADRVTDFPNPYDGDYLYTHYVEQAREEGKHGATLKKRGAGFSFKAGSHLARNFIHGESELAFENIKSYAIANEKEYLTKDGVLNKFIDIVDFLAIHTPFPSTRGLKDSMNDMHWKLGYKESESSVERGVKNEVLGVTLKNDHEKARGKRGSLIMWEEAGKFTSFLSAWQIARPSVEEDGFAFGQMLAYGTGGTEGADFEGLQEIFYRPDGYNIKGIRNVFDKNVENGAYCAFFFATYLNAKGYYDKDGNSDVIGALLEKIKQKDHIRHNTADPHAILQFIAENPITPQDAIMRVEGNRFPVAELREHLSNILPNKESFVASHFIGLPIVKSDGTVEIDMMSGKSPVREFPIKDNKNKEGCVEIFTQPIRRPDGSIPFGRYLAGMDTYDDDESGTTSLGSIFILDSVTDRIVAEYTGRPVSAKDFYGNCHKLLKYFNALCNYENDKKGFFAYMENNRGLHFLADNPQILKNMDMIKPNYFGNKLKGTNSSVKVNAFGRSLYADWLREKAYGIETDAEGNEIIVPNVYKIRSIGLIQETIAWNPEGNFDRVSAMGMLMILREDRAKLEVSLVQGTKGIAQDKFFSKHFNKFNNPKSAIAPLIKSKNNTQD